jgi:hypothetical protein
MTALRLDNCQIYNKYIAQIDRSVHISVDFVQFIWLYA